ncbi:hypothetical protein KDL01_31430 [Actinospica durhamensis]|uniref:DUF3885 domain-containing protein n=1 Tax=Actinospica durhamensis TaxID=1508375 RepID=A0A941F092_9ACTN|nr:hypothetical protein [Actinospica durhamensis]MBR7837829.1 hypothetical protein [Actinospica durhamensis]
MKGELRPLDIARFDVAWNRSWSGCPPATHLLRHRFAEQWVRFHTLPGSKRYASSETERDEILRRHHALLLALLGEATTGCRQTLMAVTCSWSVTSSPTRRDSAVAAAVPRATHWRSDDLATEPGFHSWQHHYASPLTLTDPELDGLLMCVADDMTDGVILTDVNCTWVFHPYDGGAEVLASSRQERDQLAAAYADWLPPVPSET